MLLAHHKGINPAFAVGTGPNNLSRSALTPSLMMFPPSCCFPLGAEKEQGCLRLTLPKDRGGNHIHTHTSADLKYLQKPQHNFGKHSVMKIRNQHCRALSFAFPALSSALLPSCFPRALSSVAVDGEG